MRINTPAGSIAPAARDLGWSADCWQPPAPRSRFSLPLRADLRNLLPPQERSVRDLERIERRTQSLGLVLVALSGNDAARRSAAAHSLAARIRAFDPALVADVVSG